MRINIASTRLAFFLIAVLLLLVVLSAIIPQKDLAGARILDWQDFLGQGYSVIETMGLDRIYFTPPFFIVLGLLAVNLIAGNIRRFGIIYRTEKTLVKARHLGSVLFHLSLLVIIGAVLLNYLFKFQGVYALTEGQTATDARPDYFRIFEGPLHGDRFGAFTLKLDEVNPSFTVSGARTDAARISLRPATDESPIHTTILINRPLKWRDLEFHFGALTGYSPEVLVTDDTGAQVFRNFIRLSTRKEEGRTVYADFVLLPRENLKINIDVRPRETAGDSSDFFVVVEHGHNPVYEGTLALTDTVSVENLRLTIPRLRRWCYIDVVDSPFLNLVFVGFWMALAGLVIGFIPRVAGRRKTEE